MHVSRVRSLHLDDWSQDKLELMVKGGNTRLSSYFAGYDLNEENVKTKYSTVAGEHYRNMLKCEAEGKELLEEPPSYEEGRRIHE